MAQDLLVDSSSDRANGAHVGLRISGTVTWFCPDRGFGFVAPEDGGDDVFVSWVSLPGQGFRVLRAGQPVTFILDRDRHGPVAHQVESSG